MSRPLTSPRPIDPSLARACFLVSFSPPVVVLARYMTSTYRYPSEGEMLPAWHRAYAADLIYVRRWRGGVGLPVSLSIPLPPAPTKQPTTARQRNKKAHQGVLRVHGRIWRETRIRRLAPRVPDSVPPLSVLSVYFRARSRVRLGASESLEPEYLSAMYPFWSPTQSTPPRPSRPGCCCWALEPNRALRWRLYVVPKRQTRGKAAG